MEHWLWIILAALFFGKIESSTCFLFTHLNTFKAADCCPWINHLYWFISSSACSVLPQSVKEKTKWSRHQEMSLLLKETLSHSTALLRPVEQTTICSGINKMETTAPSSSLVVLHGIKGTQKLSSGRDFHPHWIPPTNQFLWRSRSFMCLTLLCTTVLWGPQWQETPKLWTKTFGAKTTQYSTTSTRGSHTLFFFYGWLGYSLL